MNAGAKIGTAIVTPSYAGDAERARHLCASVDEFVSADIEHVLVVPQLDIAHFKDLESNRRRIVLTEDVLPNWFVRAPFIHHWYSREIWLTPFSLPVRGWILQQILKLSVPDFIDCEAIVFADSDVMFVRPFATRHIARDGLVRLYRVPDGTVGSPIHARSRQWHQQASRLVGLPKQDYFGADYVGSVISWRRSALLAFQCRVQETLNVDWRLAIARTMHFSEYTAYGVFVDEVLGARAGHYAEATSLCHSLWHYDATNPDSLRDFAAGLGPHHLAIHVQSNIGVSPETCRDLASRAISAME